MADAAAAINFGRLVPAGGRVAWAQGCAEPLPLTSALVGQRQRIGGFSAFVGASFAPASVDPAFAGEIAYSSYIGMGRNLALAKAGLLDALPTAYSRLGATLPPLDLLLVQLAQGPDGSLRYALACEYLPALARRARAVVAEVNAQAPWSPQAPAVEPGDLAALVRTSRPAIEWPAPAPDGAIASIAATVAGLVEDGATLQVGVGSLPEAALLALSGHRDLGVHSGAIGDGVAALMEAGVVTNARKRIDTGVTVAGVFFGTGRLNRLAHGNASIRLAPTEYTHDAATLSQLDRFVSLNAAIEVDLTGQVNSEVANGVYVGGVGGAAEFARAAMLSRGGVPVVALASTAARGSVSRIVRQLSGPVTVPRSDAGVIVTEFGAADLRGKSLAERRRLMIDLAHPDFRAALDGA